jgi:hypothetical protein
VLYDETAAVSVECNVHRFFHESPKSFGHCMLKLMRVPRSVTRETCINRKVGACGVSYGETETANVECNTSKPLSGE